MTGVWCLIFQEIFPSKDVRSQVVPSLKDRCSLEVLGGASPIILDVGKYVLYNVDVSVPWSEVDHYLTHYLPD